MRIYSHFKSDRDIVLFNGDCRKFVKKLPSGSIDLTVTSPPYFMGKDYDKSTKVEDFLSFHREFLVEVVRATKEGGSICWQVGYHVKAGVVVPLDLLIYDIFNSIGSLSLRNRIVWTYGHGLHSRKRFSGRHEVILWFTKGDDYFFDLDSVRVPQKYPGKKHYKGSKRGQFSGNPHGKNPSDVWDIPNVKANHIEKTKHPCQFPVALVQRLIRALTRPGDRIFDPFLGSGTTGVAAILEGRRFVGCENNGTYWGIAKARCGEAMKGRLQYRPIDKPLLRPTPNMAVALKPLFFV